MSRYFFDLHDEQSTTRDTVGMECGDDNAVGVSASRILAEIAAGEPLKVGQRKLFTSVRDEAGRVVYVSTLTLTGTEVSAPAKAACRPIVLQAA